MISACVDCGCDITARVVRYRLARRCEQCTAALNVVRAATRYAAQPRRELHKAEPTALDLALLELERLRAEARALRRVYRRAPPPGRVRENEAQQRAVRARISLMLSAIEAEPAVQLRARSMAHATLAPGWHLRW